MDPSRESNGVHRSRVSSWFSNRTRKNKTGVIFDKSIDAANFSLRAHDATDPILDVGQVDPKIAELGSRRRFNLDALSLRRRFVDSKQENRPKAREISEALRQNGE